jgi:hypothetical protein
MKRFSIFLIIAIVVLSLATVTVLSDGGNKFTGHNSLRLEDADQESNGNSMQLQNTQNEKIKENLKERLGKSVFNEDSFKVRQIGSQIKEKLTVESNKAIKSFQNSLINAEKLRVKVGLNTEKLMACKKDGNSTLCTQLKNQSISDARDYLSNIIDAMTSQLTSVRSQLNGSEELDQDVVNERIAKIDNLLSDLSTLKTKIQNDTKEGLIADAKVLKDLLKDARAISSLSTETVKYGRVGEIVKRAESLEAQLARIQEKYSQNITNNTQLNSLITQFNDKITDARQKYDQSLDKFNQAKDETNSTSNHDLIQQGHDLLVKAQQDLKDAHNLLKQIFSILKGIDKNIDFNNDKCSDDRPLFIPGKDLGYFVWQNKCNDKIFNVAFSGDTRNLPSNTTNLSSYKHSMNGTIATNGEFKDIELLRFENNDTATVNGSVITFNNYVSTGSDGIRFKTTGTTVTLDLMVDGQRQTGLIYIGKNATNPTSIPFTLNVISANQTQCGTNQFIVNGNCSNSTGTNQAADESN